MLSGISTVSRPAAFRITQSSETGPVRAVDPVHRVGARKPSTEVAKRPGDAVVLSVSEEARRLAQDAVGGRPATQKGGGSQEAFAVSSEAASAARSEEDSAASSEETSAAGRPEGAETASPSELTEEQEKQVDELGARDLEVRAHEQAHKSVGGQYAGSIHYDFQRGPDGRNYAVGGHVDIDVSEVPGDPAATVAKMQQVIRAALAPAEPSSADRAVAATASSKASEARQELAEETTETSAERDAVDPIAAEAFSRRDSDSVGSDSSEVGQVGRGSREGGRVGSGSMEGRRTASESSSQARAFEPFLGRRVA